MRLCTADTILEHPTLGSVLLRIHHAVHNPNAQNTLLSEYQLSEYGCLIDAKPTHHKYPNGQFGTQSFKLPTGDHLWKFDIDNYLMTLPHLAPDLEELEVLDPQPITGEHSWRPSDHHSIFNSLDGTVLTFANNEVATLIGCNVVMLEGDKSLAIYFDSFESPPEDYYDALSDEDYTLLYRCGFVSRLHSCLSG